MIAALIKTQSLPAHLTSYDLLKSLAIVLMVIDHVGMFIFPDEAWFRVIGRLSVPIWFFLIGFANTRDIPWMLVGGVVLLSVSSVFAGYYLFPLNILVPLMLARLMIDQIMVSALRSTQSLAGMFCVLVFSTFPTFLFFEYGTIVFLFAMLGYICRHRAHVEISGAGLAVFVAASFMAYLFSQVLQMSSLDATQFCALVAGLFVLAIVLLMFKAKAFENLSGPLFWIFQICGRRSLEIYVLHLLAFRIWSMALNPEGFSWADMRLFFYHDMAQMFL